jgi:type I restriction enzyme S subunit
VKAGWQVRKIGDICQVMTGGTPSKLKPEYFGGSIKWLVSGDIHQGEIYDCEGRITEAGLKNSNARLLPINSVMIALNGQGKTRGTVAILRTQATCNQSLICITPKEPDKLLPEYLYANLHGRYQEIRRMTGDSGNDRRGLNMGLIKNIEIPIAPLSEQQHIVAILDEAFDGIAKARANAEKNLQNARALFESHLQAIFTQRGNGWTEKKLSDVCAITSTLVDPRKDEFLDLTHVGAGNIESQTGVFVELKTAREEGLISGKFLFDKSMVLYSKIRPYLMKVARPNFNGLCSADMYPLAPLPQEITRDYLFHLLLSKPFTDYAIQGSARAGMPKVNREHLFEYRAWLPDVKKQTKLAAQLDALHEQTKLLESLYQRKLAALDELKQSLLHQAFSGQL